MSTVSQTKQNRTGLRRTFERLKKSLNLKTAIKCMAELKKLEEQVTKGNPPPFNNILGEVSPSNEKLQRDMKEHLHALIWHTFYIEKRAQIVEK